ncbi:hypothetical protein SK355_00365 [Candidatus Fukatsuia symbiotica]|uniref:Uncharacterized protein n=1 Tax=Candidatus Fukatsuia symbiotica TaxID=1878942 RepID=A0A2U8I7B6_9GAMM|nr:hypothetical protein [Candidatus Fukatsuia symbiotica]AWK15018.1 hypothetical protein CCS41_11955 [Candidatus Fukatsuia symbiotica]MEA9443816.1 hypothetical protein [Candidatus Fukatsuia symbiotica]
MPSPMSVGSKSPLQTILPESRDEISYQAVSRTFNGARNSSDAIICTNQAIVSSQPQDPPKSQNTCDELHEPTERLSSEEERLIEEQISQSFTNDEIPQDLEGEPLLDEDGSFEEFLSTTQNTSSPLEKRHFSVDESNKIFSGKRQKTENSSVFSQSISQPSTSFSVYLQPNTIESEPSDENHSNEASREINSTSNYIESLEPTILSEQEFNSLPIVTSSMIDPRVKAKISEQRPAQRVNNLKKWGNTIQEHQKNSKPDRKHIYYHQEFISEFLAIPHCGGVKKLAKDLNIHKDTAHIWEKNLNPK